MKEFRRKCPNPATRFSWSRVMGDSGGVTYRLFRRDHKGALHLAIWRFKPDDSRDAMMRKLCEMRHELLERVDKIELHLLGVAS
ncbi:hypothetical protein [Dyella mobilis]|uniref:Uncharacterized protein n=1 Tax=Dyella mobilis TaxID=1849582 RepID=A0ABS2KKQ2_9GAMM|nr:hypothetical protein [Dyella mobilis]MBM7131600.1 hypothetical protein [Dyella mobilis]GLQ96425.1 hypothetical protein GCM10007863_08430 [Dyella mobilis]